MSPPDITHKSGKSENETEITAKVETTTNFTENVKTHNDAETIASVEIDDVLPEVDKTEDITLSFSALTTEVHQVNVATLVFFDIETTGLASCVGKKNVQITEISMIAVGRDDFCRCTYPDLRDIRIVHKLSLCTKPRCPISRDAANITGLTDSSLADQAPFDENTAALTLGFLSHLPKPVCILAHNGKLFDFPVLKAEFEKLNRQLPLDLYIVDTLAGFRKLNVPDLPFSQKLHKDVRFKKNGDISYALLNLHLYFFGKPHMGSHSSEGDCIALAKVCHKVRDKIIPWIEKNCLTFDSVKPMW